MSCLYNCSNISNHISRNYERGNRKNVQHLIIFMFAGVIVIFKPGCLFIFQTSCSKTDGTYPKHSSGMQRILFELGISMMPDRRLCIDGRILKGLRLPKNNKIQAYMMRRIVVWYWPCIEFMNATTTTGSHIYQVSKSCLLQRENELIKLISKHSAWKRRRQIDLFYWLHQ